MRKGIDVSKWQGDIDFKKVKDSGVEFVILRSSYGQRMDPMFLKNVGKCKAVGLKIAGVYHFAYPLNVEMVKSEADFCIDAVLEAGLDKDAVIFFDLEYDSVRYAKTKGVTIGKSECITLTKTFCSKVEAAGFKAGVYYNGDYYKSMYTPEVVNQYVRWLADWSGNADYPCEYHQYSEKGKVPGINGNVDMNYCLLPATQKPTQKPTPVPQRKPLDEIVMEVYDGRWGNGDEREKRLTAVKYNYDLVQNRIKIIDQLAKEVKAGRWGNGDERKLRLQKAGYNYDLVQFRVNQL